MISRNGLLFSLTLCLSAGLLFSLQPMVGKILLPVFGGSSSVWNTCLVAYQLLYLGGCLWVFALNRFVPGRAQFLIHLAAMAAVFLVLPPQRLMERAASAPVGDNPVPWLLGNLFGIIGPPLFLTSTTSSLLQSWYSRLGEKRSNDPYYLSMASNFGSGLALLSYPFLFEANFGLRTQGNVWTFAYIALVICVATCAFLADKAKVPGTAAATANAPAPRWTTRGTWVLLALLPTSLLSGTTFYLSELVSVIPLLWILPLFFFLVSLIVAFSPRAEGMLRWMVPAALALALPWFFTAWEDHNPIWMVLPLHLTAFFLLITALHTELVKRRPATSHLAEFYLWMAVGGAIGGMFNGLLAPSLFTRALEYPLGIALSSLALGWFVYSRAESRHSGWLRWAGAVVPLCFAVKVALHQSSNGLFYERNFYGITKVTEDVVGNRYLFHNSFMQSKQGVGEGRREPYANLGRESAIGILLDKLNQEAPAPNVAVIGMGAGVLAVYAQPGTQWTFYELNPSIVKAVHEQKLFTYLQDSPAKMDVVLGDARRQIEKAPNGFYDLVVVDAFNSTSMPAHLMTQEAFSLYFEKLKPTGIIAINNISMLFDLAKVACDIAHQKGWTCAKWSNQDWVFVAKDPAKLARLNTHADWNLVTTTGVPNPWTDEYSNPSGVIHWPKLRKARAWLRSLSGG